MLIFIGMHCAQQRCRHLQRDPKTGKVIAAGVDPQCNNCTEDPVHGEVRRAFRGLLDEERKAQLATTQSRAPLAAGSAPGYTLRCSLLVKEEVEVEEQSQQCPNSYERTGTWVGTRRYQSLEPIAPSRWPFLNRLAHLCRAAGIRPCTNPACMDNREAVEKAAPSSDWQSFRDWAVTVVCCEVSCRKAERLRRPFFHLAAAANSCHWLLVEYQNGRKDCSNIMFGTGGEETELDLFGVCEIIYWLVTVQSSLGRNDVLQGQWGPDFLAPGITQGPVARAAELTRTAGICPDRLWNLALVSERKQVDLPCLMDAVTGHPELKHTGHEHCIVGFCRTATVDSTKVQQLHRPGCPHDCPMLEFDPGLLAQSINDGGRTCWTLTEPYEVAQHQPYIAISHVWSDGTGIGVQDPGKINKCLFEYMSRVAKRLDCDGIWWDTISIPTEPEARRKAINDMHLNYQSAEYTVLHDNYLLNYEWSDDGSPCVAILFSPWLTRGWTALELIMSRKVKVLFKSPEDPTHPVIKDLDDDVLAKDPARCTRAHWIASTIIRPLRRPIDNVTDLLAVLKPRHTSWPRDRMIIAGLLSGLQFDDYNIPQDKITKDVLLRVQRVSPCSLQHGKETLTQKGGWSWCPPSLYDMPANTVADLFGRGTAGDNTCIVDAHGVLAGAWYYRPVEEVEVTQRRIVPNATQLSLITKINTTLNRWHYCLLLRESPHDKGPALLVIPQGRDRDFIHCKFIGSVLVFEPSSSQTARGDQNRNPYSFDFFQIGSENEDLPAKLFLESQPPCLEEDYQWLHHKL